MTSQAVPPGVDVNFLTPQALGLVALVLLFVGLRVVLRSPIGEAIAEQIRMRGRRRSGMADGESASAAALAEQVAALQAQVSELAERLDFAERLLAERRERKLGAGQ